MKSVVTFVGAGPGASDLITVRGLKALEGADAVLYAGSLVDPALLQYCSSECICLDSAGMSLEEQIAFMCSHTKNGRRVVRLHTGDPSLYGATNEQIRLLKEQGIASCIVPGVSSVFGAAAALGCELTNPGICQSVVLTRMPGRTPMPEQEDSAAFARTGATLVFFLSASRMEELAQDLMARGGLAPDTPAAVVYRATWPDERVVRGSLATISNMAKEAGITRQALVLVGRALEEGDSVSHLYASEFSHGYRNHLASEDFEGRCALYAFGSKGCERAMDIASALALPVTVYMPSRHYDAVRHEHKGKCFYEVIPVEGVSRSLQENWNNVDAHIVIGAAGIAVRSIAPLIQNKTCDPAVIVCPERESVVIPLLAGHLGGANRLARRIARILGGHALITTATDSASLPAFDEVAAREKARVCNPEQICALNTALIRGSDIAFYGAPHIFEQFFAKTPNIHFSPEQPAPFTVIWDASEKELPTSLRQTQSLCTSPADAACLSDTPFFAKEGAPHVLHITSRAFILGVSCAGSHTTDSLIETVRSFLRNSNRVTHHLAGIAFWGDALAKEKLAPHLEEAFAIPVTMCSCEDFEQLSHLLQKGEHFSGAFFAASLVAGRPLAKQISTTAYDTGNGLSLALVRIPHGNYPTQRGKVNVVGLGSGMAKHITPEVENALRSCDVIAGYSGYIDFISDRIAGKALIRTGMKGEVERCRTALEAARLGLNVCLVCSGDPGILAMAGLIFELRAREALYTDVPVSVLPGITAASIAAATLGAPLQNGFSLVSLSDLLVPADEVRKNIAAVAASALPVALYNPAGRKRRALLQEALAMFAHIRGSDTLCACVHNAGRPEECRWVGKLADISEESVNMSTLLLIGGSRTRYVGDVLYEARGYAEKYLDTPSE